MKLAGTAALVTGASQGLGLAIATALAREGSDVAICARSAGDLAGAAETIAAAAPGRRVVPIPADVSRAGDVAALVATAERELGGLDVLVCNAGVFGAFGPIDEVDWDEWERGIAINLLGTVRCVRAALPLLRRARRRAKIVITSGGGAERAHPYISAYGASKAGLIRFGEALALYLGTSADVNMLAPGRLATRMARQVLAAGPEKVGRYYYEEFSALETEGKYASLDEAAALAVFLASAGSDGITGRLIHAARDKWRTLAEHREELAASDVFTLRRVEPKDRGFSW